MNKPKAIVIDLDSTLYNVDKIDTERTIYCQDNADRWEYFHQHLHEAELNMWCYNIIYAMYKYYNVQVIFVTARVNTWMDKTIEQLNELNIDYELYMRMDGDYSSTSEVKKDILRDYILDNYDVIFAIDDIQENCDMFKELGIPSLKVC